MMADASDTSDSLAPPLPERIAHYDIFNNRELGRGSFGSVCVGRDTQNNRHVAIKRVTIDNPRNASRIESCIKRELKALRSISHPHITKLLHYERSGIHAYFVLELCNKDLQKFARYNRELCDLKLQFTEEFALAVECLHNHGVIHRDIKPENVLVKSSEGSWTTKMSDLGLSRHIPPEIGSASIVATGGVGTEPWMAPEVIPTDGNAKYGKRADTFSLGLLTLSVVDHRPGEALNARTGILCISL